MNDYMMKLVEAKLSAMIEGGEVEKIVENRVTSLIQDLVEHSLRSYGEFGEALKVKVDASINAAIPHISLPEYNQFIKKVTEETFIEVLQEDAVKHLTEIMGEMLKPIKAEEKISTLLHEVEEMWGDIAREKGKDYIKIDCEANSEENFYYITFHHPEWKDYTIRASFYSFEKEEDPRRWHVGYISRGGNQTLTGDPLNRTATYLGDLGGLLYKYYVRGTQFEMDDEVADIYVGV